MIEDTDLYYTITLDVTDMQKENKMFAQKVVHAILDISSNIKRLYDCDFPKNVKFQGRIANALKEQLEFNSIILPDMNLIVDPKTTLNQITISLGTKIKTNLNPIEFGGNTNSETSMKSHKNMKGNFVSGLFSGSIPGAESVSDVKVEKYIDPTAIISLKLKK